MPNNVSPGYNGTRIDMSAAPGADLDWDNLFPNPENPTASSPQATQETTLQQQPQATQDQWFLRSNDGKVVYRTSEDAVKGLSAKDTEIERLRGYLKDHGVDPNNLQRNAQTQPQAEPQVVNTQTFFDKVADAAGRGDKAGYENAMKEFFSGLIEPWRPTLAEMNRFKAYQQVAREIPGFKEYYENGGYQSTLDQNPLFKDMNAIGESDPVAAGRLPDLYRSAYFYFKGATPPTQTTIATQATTPTVASRPTLQNSSLTPPAPSVNTSGWADPNWRGARPLGNEARKQLIQDGDTKFNGMKFEDVGL